jgi:hypothetical protein
MKTLVIPDLIKVEDIKRPLKKGEWYLVPCIIEERTELKLKYFRGQSSHEPKMLKVKCLYITPVFNHPHNDKENGQVKVHYHADFRFIRYDKKGIIRKHSRHFFGHQVRPILGKHGNLEYIPLPVVNEIFVDATPKEFIKNSKLKHRCIHKNKCPHRGYDLSQVKDVNGIITCPLHGLQFYSDTKLLIEA